MLQVSFSRKFGHKDKPTIYECVRLTWEVYTKLHFNRVYTGQSCNFILMGLYIQKYTYSIFHVLTVATQGEYMYVCVCGGSREIYIKYFWQFRKLKVDVSFQFNGIAFFYIPFAIEILLIWAPPLSPLYSIFFWNSFNPFIIFFYCCSRRAKVIRTIHVWQKFLGVQSNTVNNTEGPLK